MTETYFSLVSNRAGDAEALKTLADCCSSVGSSCSALLESDCATYCVSPLCVLKADWLDAFNDFAEAVEAMPSREKQIPKLKALLEHFEVTDLATAAGLAEHIGDYILTPEISSPQEAAIDELNFTMDAHSAELLLPHVNLFTYGNEIIKDDNAALTSYGLLHREDYQPMQTPVQETQEQAMTME